MQDGRQRSVIEKPCALDLEATGSREDQEFNKRKMHITALTFWVLKHILFSL